MEYIRIGNVKIERTAALAPMASVADRAYRLMCREFGAAYTVSEMISSKGLCYGDKKSAKMCRLDDRDRPSAIQLFGEDPEFVGRAAFLLGEYKPDIIDLNMGCPVPKIVGSGSGSALMKTPEIAEKICAAAVKNADCPVTVKMRIGWDEQSINAVDFAKRMEQAGAAALAVHGRTRRQMYSGKADRDMIRRVKEAVSIPVIGNGDVSDPLDCKAMYEQTGCDLVMIGRGSYGRPWVFEEVRHYLLTGELLPEKSVEERMEIMLRHAGLLIADAGEAVAMKEMRHNVIWYVKGLHGAAAYRRECGELTTLEGLKALAARVIEDNQ